MLDFSCYFKKMKLKKLGPEFFFFGKLSHRKSKVTIESKLDPNQVIQTKGN